MARVYNSNSCLGFIVQICGLSWQLNNKKDIVLSNNKENDIVLTIVPHNSNQTASQT